ncbi:hypothetical protein QJS10_CPB21g01383 [Acorus calamus]|uniref:Uncharacterized protein n=1 Tax=Acorus calamus TaxID=4465 RepID=A0AAV9C874_ACOCL|nr:hypothetical protein QJS10_CPB21g01383 [Acorus calamus]
MHNGLMASTLPDTMEPRSQLPTPNYALFEKISLSYDFATRKNPGESYIKVKNGNCTLESLEDSEYVNMWE